jgi:transcriptional regulator with XRE-family HTH domain
MSQKQSSRAEEAKAIGKEIWRLCKERGLTHAQFASLLGLSVPAVNKLFRGVGCVQFAKLSTICNVLGTEPNHLLGFDESVFDRSRAVYTVLLESLGLPDDVARKLTEVAMSAIFEESSVPGVDPFLVQRVQVYLETQKAISSN